MLVTRNAVDDGQSEERCSVLVRRKGDLVRRKTVDAGHKEDGTCWSQGRKVFGVRCWSEGRVMLVRKVIGGEVDLKCWTE